MKDFPFYSKDSSSRLVRKKALDEKWFSFRFFITIIILFFIAFFFVHQRIEYIQRERNVRKLLVEKRNLISAILPLKLEERFLAQPNKIREIAESKLGLRDQQKWQLVNIPLKVENKQDE